MVIIKKKIFIYGAGEACISTIYSLWKFIKELNIIGFIDDDLNKVGSYKVDINFHSEVSAQILIKIDKSQSK